MRDGLVFMNCEYVRQLFYLYVENELEPSQRAEVLAHLLKCPECERAVREARALSAALAQKPVVEPTLDFSARVRQRLLNEGLVVTPRRRAAWRWFSFEASFIAAGAATVLCAMLWMAGASPLTAWTAVASFLSDITHNVVTFFLSLPGTGAALLQSGRGGLPPFNSGLISLPPFVWWLAMGLVVIWNVWIQWQGMQRARTLLRGE